MTERLVVLLDMDCFYVQVEERHYPHIKGLPAAVVQYNAWKGGGIIAVNYEARAFGVKRGMRGDEARSKCPNIQLITVPVNRGKADLTRYRDAGKEVIDVLCDYGDCVERASIDEAYIDFTNIVQDRIKKAPKMITLDELKSTWVVGYDEVTDEMTPEEKEEIRKIGIRDWLSLQYGMEEESSSLDGSSSSLDNIRLAHTAVLCEQMRAAVLERTGFKCSAGIAHNKVLGKLSCGLHKPNQQTVLPLCEVGKLWDTMPVGKVRNLGGKLGDSIIEELGCKTMGDISRLSVQQLTARYDNKTAHWLHNLGKGIDTEPVTSRQLPKSIGCGKNFQGKEILNTQEKVQTWMLSLAEELEERLNGDQTSNKRRAKTLSVSVRLDGDDRFTSMSRSSNLTSYSAERIARIALSLIQHTNQASSKHSWQPPIKNISLSAGRFEDWTSAGSGDIQEMFKKARENNKNNFNSSKLEDKKNSNSKTTELELGQPKSVEEHISYMGNSDTTSSQNSASKISPAKNGDAKTNPKVSNSFFRNLLFKRETRNTEIVEAGPSNLLKNCTKIGLVEQSTTPSTSNYSNDKENEEEDNDLDLLVSCLSNEEDLCVGENREGSDNSDYGDTTDIDSDLSVEAVGRLAPQSQDLFAESELQEEGSSCKLTSETSDSIRESMLSGKMVRESMLSGKMVDLDSSLNEISESEESPNISVEELFPDLDNIDDSVLSLLPKDLKSKVEKAVKDHKIKSRPKKSGLWKYMANNPLPQKDTFNTCNGINDANAGSSRTFEKCEELNSSRVQSLESLDENSNPATVSSSKVSENERGADFRDTVECEICGLGISPFETVEHADYHMAMSLQSDLQREGNHVNRKESEKKCLKSQKCNSSRKRTKVNVKMCKNSKVQKIDSYFKS